MRVVKVYCRALWRAGRADRPRVDDGTSAARRQTRARAALPLCLRPRRAGYNTARVFTL